MKILSHDYRFNTFLKKGLPNIDDRFGVYYVCGKMGSGKTYFACYLASRQSKDVLNKIYTNIQSFNVPDVNIVYFTKLEDIYFNTDDYCIFIIDELARRFTKDSKTDKDFYAFLNQSRKMKRIVIMITQEWRELPMWLRRPARYMFTTRPTRILNNFGIFTTVVGDAENMFFDKDEGEYICPTIESITYKRNLDVGNMYDTFEAINEL